MQLRDSKVRPIRILFVRNGRGIWDMTGPEAYLLSLVKSLEHQCCDIRLVCSTKESRGEPPWLRDFRSSGLPVEAVPTSSRISTRDLLAVVRSAREFDADLIAGLDHRADVIAVMAAKLTGKPSIAWFTGWGNWKDLSATWKLYAWLDRQALARMQAVIADSAFISKKLDPHMHDSPVLVIHNGVDIDRFDPSRATPAVKARFFGREDVVMLGMLGRIHPIKGQLEFVKAAGEIARSHSNVRFLIIGDASAQFQDYKQSVLAEIASSGLGERLHMTTLEVDEIPSVVASMDILVAPSHLESCSIAILEGMASGRPIIASDAGGNAELVEHGETGILVRPGQPRELETAAEELIADEARRRRMGMRSRARVESRFRVDLMASRTLSVFREVVDWHSAESRASRSSTALRGRLTELVRSWEPAQPDRGARAR